MSKTLIVEGVTPTNDEQYVKMLAVHDACVSTGILIPDTVAKFFDYNKPDPKGLIVPISMCTTSYVDDMREGFEVDVSKIPANVKFVRFYIAY